MKISLKCFSSLATSGECAHDASTDHELERGAVVSDLLERIDRKPSDVKLVFVNGVREDLATELRDGDRVALAPATGGM